VTEVGIPESKPWVRLRELAGAADAAGLRQLVDALGEADRIHSFARLSPEERSRVLELLDPERAADVLGELPDSHAAEAIEELPPGAAAEILEELVSDERADLLGRLASGDAEAILAESTPETADSVRALLRYPPESAGGLMITEYVAVPETATAQEVVAHLRGNVERYAGYIVQYVYAVGPKGELRGVLPLRDLLLARGERPVASLMIRAPASVRASAPRDEVFELFDRHAFVGIPVIEAGDRLVGVLLREHVDRARVGRAEAEGLKARGIVGGEELRSMPVLLRSRRRLSWLSVNIALNVVAASVIALYQETLQAAIALAVFLPIISDMSGCSGNQAVAVSLRELALGVTRPHELLRVWLKEAVVGCLNGLALGLLIAGVAWLWKGNLALGLVVGVALAANTLVAVSIGGLVPLVLRRLGHDPALASGPILTTVTDMCGFFLVLSLASQMLAWLAPGAAG
jgi:magnesium transporter